MSKFTPKMRNDWDENDLEEKQHEREKNHRKERRLKQQQRELFLNNEE